MKIPKYWAKEEIELDRKNGAPLDFPCWRWSDISLEDALQKAKESAGAIRAKLAGGAELDKYFYAERPLREEIIGEIKRADASTAGILTRNHMGCEVLNSEDVLFIDIDVPALTKRPGIFKKLMALFSRPLENELENIEQIELAKIRKVLERHPDWGLSVYRTYAGFRCMATHETFDPKSDFVRNILDEFGSDPLYVRLCRVQESFRARLTPKPWRCRFQSNKIKYPAEGRKMANSFAVWLEKYKMASANFATCRLVGRFGRSDIHPKIKEIVKFHDSATKAMERTLPLA